MAISPSHKLGQILGKIIENLMASVLQKFCNDKGLYLDKYGERAARKSKKVKWKDKYGNSHELDFVIEKNGSDEKIGQPVAFIESAWRRYTKHSKNKAQEIQGAILPILDNEKQKFGQPFIGAVLAGYFTTPSILQLESLGFSTLLLPYDSIVSAFTFVNIDIQFDENTSDDDFANIIKKIENLSNNELLFVKNKIYNSNKILIDKFLKKLSEMVDRYICEINLIPLHGKIYNFTDIEKLKLFLYDYKKCDEESDILYFKIIIKYNNGSHIDCEFKSKIEVQNFLSMLEH